ncbi:MAG: LytTR family DNA-binding domain-containing protein [Bacteroidales bacterium]|nr:LytTR family DNA-binding domain-containing protein [Bacteroidales bacterium]
MEKIRTLVVDDEPLALEMVADYVNQTPFLSLVSSCANAKDAFDEISKGDIQLVFCDIQMPGVSGLTLTKMLSALEKRPHVIFTTAYPQYALDGFKLDVIDYLLKPFDMDEFLKAATKAKRMLELEEQASVSLSGSTSAQQPTEPVEGQDFFFVKSEYKLVRINKSEVIYIEGLKDYIKIHLDQAPKPILTLMSLKDMMQKLNGSPFVRVHRSFIVNTSFIRGVERGQIAMSQGSCVPIGDQYKQQFNEVISGKIF